ncbi:MAG TPA: diguanylate cyclase, partial [Steroidobacteraceae bacterium]|nr:diguanylate cyclase [Steroidobacteraceae bacterium]
AEELVGVPFEQMTGQHIDAVVVLTHPRSRNVVSSVLALCVTRGESVRRPERCLLQRPDGTPRYVVDVASPVSGSDGEVSGAVVVLQDATEGFEHDRELHHRAAHDPLTGLTNRFEFERVLTECLNGYRYIERPATLLLIDLDRFKEVNDRGGHAAGDEMLRRVARELTSVVRESDTVARIGGDEFAILLTQFDPTRRAEQIGARLLRAIAELTVTWDGARYNVGASVGAASLGPHIEDVAGWVEAADRACYDAKRAGRGQMRVGT